jgi:DNA-binding transcriptional regulator WhiA
MNRSQRKVLAYVVGVALGDGNLSNPNGRATRLRITCSSSYPKLAREIIENIQILLPHNKISIVRVPHKNTYFNISVYSNKLNEWMPWKVGRGSKLQQRAHVPAWIQKDKKLSKECLRGLLQTDGSIYQDRGYLMVNFTNHVQPLAKDVSVMLTRTGFSSSTSQVISGTGVKYCVRVARDTQKLLDTLKLYKA